ncbi:MAG: hypothetical protein JWN84_596 [Nocardioides sp.]|nr:hypothetical protein [Nocardioides sp.]
MRRVGRLLALATALPFVAGMAAAGATPPGQVELTFADPEIVESSGLTADADLVHTVNDSGDTGRVFSVDRATGRTVGVTTWADDPADVEALAPGPRPGQVWVADIGDNAQERSSVEVALVPVGEGDRDVRGEVVTYELTYPDGARDAETLLLDPASGRLVVVTKEIFGGDVLVAPTRLDPDRPNRLRSVGTATSIATDGAFFPDGRHLVVRGYSSAVTYTWPGLDVVGRFDLPEQQQGEGVAVDADGTVLVSTEGARSDVLRVRLPRSVVRAVAPVPELTAEPTVATSTPAPSDEESPRPRIPTDDPSVVDMSDQGNRSFLIGIGFAVVMLVLLVRSLRPRG